MGKLRALRGSCPCHPDLGIAAELKVFAWFWTLRLRDQLQPGLFTVLPMVVENFSSILWIIWAAFLTDVESQNHTDFSSGQFAKSTLRVLEEHPAAGKVDLKTLLLARHASAKKPLLATESHLPTHLPCNFRK